MDIYLGVIALIVMLYLFPRRKSFRYKHHTPAELLLFQRQCYYQKSFMTPRERECFALFNEALRGSRYHLCAQVRLADIVDITPDFPARSPAWWSLFKQISQWHCDYIIIDTQTYEIRAVVELDDRSHGQPERQRRDRIFNHVINNAGLPLYRLRSINEYQRVVNDIRRCV